MTALTPSPVHVDSLELLRTQFPGVHDELETAGYEFAGEGVLGRCSRAATLFLALEPETGCVRGWAFDVMKKEFIGPCFIVFGPLGAAALEARELTESHYAEDQLSGTLRRHAEQTHQISHLG
jgi:hypothetical protein